MSLKSILLALGIGAASLTLSGCVSEGYYGSGYNDPYYVRGGYVGTGVVYNSGGYYRNYPRYPRYYRDSRYYRDRDYYRYRDRDRPRRPDTNRPDRPRPPRPDRPPTGNDGAGRPIPGNLPVIQPIRRGPHN
ncbi:hypothetical protein [Brucella anthropi]|uniref:hypothetical protein n=1 Tax=Brucella anthropi TaxID=529 RepID=UPI00188D9B9E|nr:hypothetical protein [Brucella anthropi]QPA29290.1 hypothetical protein IR196_13885 [Brucella anthropi]UVV68423.1 hypothetical protein NW321_04745 [Brucella anthropi]